MELYVEICPPPPEQCTTSPDMEYDALGEVNNLTNNSGHWAAHEIASLDSQNNTVVPVVITSHPCGVFFFVVYGPLFGLVCLLGLIGNSLSFAVLHKYSRSNVATYLLKALAVSDNMFLATASCVQMYPAMCMYFDLYDQIKPVYPYLQMYVWPFTHIVQMSTVYMMVLVAGNRYIAVCKPLQAPRLCTKKNVQIQILVMTTLIVIYNIPRFFEYQFSYITETLKDNSTVVRYSDENIGFASIRLYNILYENVAYCIFVFLLPLLILIIFNVHLVRDLKRAQRSRRAMTSRSSMEENNITLVMIIIIIVFIICQTPASINQILFYIIGESPLGECTNYEKYSHTSNLLITMNSSLNFVIYCLFRRQFQQELIALMCHGRKGSRPLRRTIVLRALHEPGSSFRNNTSFKNLHPQPYRTSSLVHSSASTTMEIVPLRLEEREDYMGSCSPGAQSHETTTSHLSQCNGREPMLA